MDIFLLILGLTLGMVGIIGSVVPALPGPLLTYSTLFILYYIGGESLVPISYIVYIGIFAVIVVVASNIIPIAATKMTGASKNGLYGSIIGSIIGLIIFPPFGLFFGAAIGATLGEYYTIKDARKSLGVGIGTTAGAIFVLIIQALFSVLVFSYFVFKVISLF